MSDQDDFETRIERYRKSHIHEFPHPWTKMEMSDQMRLVDRFYSIPEASEASEAPEQLRRQRQEFQQQHLRFRGRQERYHDQQRKRQQQEPRLCGD